MTDMEKIRKIAGPSATRSFITKTGCADMDKTFVGLDEPLGFRQLIFLSLQHLLAVVVPISTPPLIISSALALSHPEKSTLISMALFTSGFATLLQTGLIKKVGTRMLNVQGTSFTFVPVAIQTGLNGGLSLVMSMAMICSVTEIFISRLIKPFRKLFPPLVTGIVVTLIGLTLIQVGMDQLSGGQGASDYGHPGHLLLGFAVLITTVGVYVFGGQKLKPHALMTGLLAGTGLGFLTGKINYAEAGGQNLIVLPVPVKWGLSFDPIYILPWMVAYLMTSLESVGDISATALVSGQDAKGEPFIQRLKGGILADGLGSFVAAFFNSLPNTTFSQNNGIIQLTGVASRKVGMVTGIFLMMLGLFPGLTGYLGVIPPPVLGGAALLTFGMVTVSGLKLIFQQDLDARAQLILCLSLCSGLGINGNPNFFAETLRLAGHEPYIGGIVDHFKGVLQSGLTTGSLCAIILHLLLPDHKKQDE